MEKEFGFVFFLPFPLTNQRKIEDLLAKATLTSKMPALAVSVRHCGQSSEVVWKHIIKIMFSPFLCLLVIGDGQQPKQS